MDKLLPQSNFARKRVLDQMKEWWIVGLDHWGLGRKTCLKAGMEFKSLQQNSDEINSGRYGGEGVE